MAKAKIERSVDSECEHCFGTGRHANFDPTVRACTYCHTKEDPRERISKLLERHGYQMPTAGETIDGMVFRVLACLLDEIEERIP